MKTGREKAEEKREAKLEEIREQVDSGALVIRPDDAGRARAVSASSGRAQTV